MKNLFYLLGVMLLVTSCSSDDIESPDALKGTNPSIATEGISIVKLSDYSRGQTKSSMNESSYLLRFENETMFNKTVGALKEMPIDEQLKFYNQIGYESARAQLVSADDVLDKIFDIEDDNLFLSEYLKFQEKYKGQFVYNNDDTYDLSPYLAYSDEDLQLVGDIKGRVVVGEEFVQPKNLTPIYHEFIDDTNFQKISDNVYVKREDLPTTKAMGSMPYEPTFWSYKNATMMIKKGKYQSTMTVGRLPDVESGRMVVRYASQKKKRLWKRRHNTTYQGSIQLNHRGNIFFNCGLSKSEVYVESGVRRPDGRFHLQMNYTSGCCSGVQGNKELWCVTN